MAEADKLEEVLEFLRKNGLSVCESALMEDIMEKSQLGSSEFENFFFPMTPLPPPLKIPSIPRLPDLSNGDGESSRDSSDDEFVSLGSSTTELCSSDFTNPYGVRTTRPSSQSSSDRLSQFGTARDHPVFDMQDDLFWYKEKDEDFYITTVQAPEHVEDPAGYKFVSDGSMKHVHSRDNLSESENNFFRKTDITYDCVGGSDNSCKKYENAISDFIYDEVIAGENNDPRAVTNDESGVISDELLMYEVEEDDYDIFTLKIIHRKNRTGFEESKEFPIVMNSIIAGRYYVTEFLGSAAFSKVVQAHDLYSGMEVCLKIVKNDKDFFDQSLDELKLLKFVNKHDPLDERHILRLYDYFYHQEHLFIVTELLRANLYEFQKYNQESGGEQYFTFQRLQVITRQCLEALLYLHDLGIIHCDLKPENILIKSYRRCEIKVIDLGSSCFQTDSLSLYVQSRSYRAPEVILGLPYDQKIDLWSLGCILAELCSGEVLFPNEGVVMILARMIGVLGPIDIEMLLKGQETHKYFTKEYHLYYIDEDMDKLVYIVPEETLLEHHLHISDTCFVDFLKYLLQINPNKRTTAREALQHPWLSYSYDDKF